MPIAAVDIHLPAVPRAALTPEALRQRFGPRHGGEPEVVLEKSYASRSPARAAVLLGIVLRDEPMVLLTERTAHLSTHSGQVAFPGGRADPEDASPAHTALREAEEEVGLPRGTRKSWGAAHLRYQLLVHHLAGGGLGCPDCELNPNPTRWPICSRCLWRF